MNQLSAPARRYASVFAVIGWIALILQFYLIIENRVVGVPETILRYFSYFTILTNIIAALSYTAVWLNFNSGILNKLTTTPSLTAVTVYIVMVGIIYNTILHSLVSLEGLQLVVDRCLHVLIPVSFLVFWVLYISKESLQLKRALRWLWYPIVYIIFIIIVGAFTGFYPYPFANVTNLGYPKALLNGVWIVAAFLVLSLIFIGIARSINRKR